jgi:hypothetical protein
MKAAAPVFFTPGCFEEAEFSRGVPSARGENALGDLGEVSALLIRPKLPELVKALPKFNAMTARYHRSSGAPPSTA